MSIEAAYFDKNETYLDNFFRNFLEGRVVPTLSEELREKVTRVYTLFKEAKTDREKIPEVVHESYHLHLEALRHLKEGKLGSRALMILK